ncbi:DUF4253 domain-containing protein [Streptomyces sp. NBC_00209]
MSSALPDRQPPGRFLSSAPTRVWISDEFPQAVDHRAALRAVAGLGWEERFGARVVAVFGSELHVSVARPPVEAEHANLLALEHISRPRTTSSTTRPHRSPNTRGASGDGPPGRSGGTRVVRPGDPNERA